MDSLHLIKSQQEFTESFVIQTSHPTYFLHFYPVLIHLIEIKIYTVPKHWFPALLWRIIGGFFTFCIRILILSMRLRIQEVSHNADPDAHSVPLSVFNWHVGLNTVVLSPHRLFSCTRDYKHLVYLIITNNMIV